MVLICAAPLPFRRLQDICWRFDYAQTQPTDTISFGPTGPPDQFTNGLAAMGVATSQFYTGDDNILYKNPEPGSHGFNMHIINDTTTAMLDIPLRSSISAIQTKIKPGQSIKLEFPTAATYARLSSTSESAERKDPDYWPKIIERLGVTSGARADASIGDGAYFAMYNGWVDSSIQFVGFYNETLDQTFEDQAIAFNIYRGTAMGKWLIKSNNVTLETAYDFQTDFSIETQHPEIISSTECDWDAATDGSQKVIYCVWNSDAAAYIMTLGNYISGGHGNQTGIRKTSPLSL